MKRTWYWLQRPWNQCQRTWQWLDRCGSGRRLTNGIKDQLIESSTGVNCPVIVGYGSVIGNNGSAFVRDFRGIGGNGRVIGGKGRGIGGNGRGIGGNGRGFTSTAVVLEGTVMVLAANEVEIAVPAVELVTIAVYAEEDGQMDKKTNLEHVDLRKRPWNFRERPCNWWHSQWTRRKRT